MGLSLVSPLFAFSEPAAAHKTGHSAKPETRLKSSIVYTPWKLIHPALDKFRTILAITISLSLTILIILKIVPNQVQDTANNQADTPHTQPQLLTFITGIQKHKADDQRQKYSSGKHTRRRLSHWQPGGGINFITHD